MLGKLMTIGGWIIAIIIVLYIAHHPGSGASLGSDLHGIVDWVTGLINGASSG